MAVTNTKSTEVTNADAAVQTLNDVGLSHARAYVKLGTMSVAAADDDTSVYRFCRVHSSWRIFSILLWNDAITAGTSYDVGLYQIAAAGGAVAVAGAYGTAIDMSSARITAPFDAAFEARDIIKITQQVWQDAGASADTNRWYDLAFTCNTIGSAQGDISWAVHYTAGA